MKLWSYTVELGDIWKAPGTTLEQRRDEIVRRLRASQWYKDAENYAGPYSPLRGYVDELAKASDAAKFDAAWSAIYDEADADSAWLNITKPVVNR